MAAFGQTRWAERERQAAHLVAVESKHGEPKIHVWKIH